jgi:hypothetical protein
MVGINEELKAIEPGESRAIDKSEQQGDDQSTTGSQVCCGAGNDNIAK